MERCRKAPSREVLDHFQAEDQDGAGGQRVPLQEGERHHRIQKVPKVHAWIGQFKPGWLSLKLANCEGRIRQIEVLLRSSQRCHISICQDFNIRSNHGQGSCAAVRWWNRKSKSVCRWVNESKKQTRILAKEDTINLQACHCRQLKQSGRYWICESLS